MRRLNMKKFATRVLLPLGIAGVIVATAALGGGSVIEGGKIILNKVGEIMDNALAVERGEMNPAVQKAIENEKQRILDDQHQKFLDQQSIEKYFDKAVEDRELPATPTGVIVDINENENSME